MNSLSKAIKKLGKRDSLIIAGMIEQLLDHDFHGLHITKLKGIGNIYRVRKGRLRIIYCYEGKDLIIMHVGLRSEKTYRDY